MIKDVQGDNAGIYPRFFSTFFAFIFFERGTIREVSQQLIQLTEKIAERRNNKTIKKRLSIFWSRST